MNQGTLYHALESENGQNEHVQVVVPRSSISRILHSIHDWVSDVGVTIQLPKIWKRFY